MTPANDEHYMLMALELAAKGRGTTSPNPMVGAIVVKDDRIIGRGYHVSAGSAHAEVNALNNASEDTNGATLYVTLEPCNHTGRTLPCTEKIIESGISRVVVAIPDPNPHVTGGGIEALKSQGIAVTTGIAAEKARRLNEAFIKFIQSGHPFVMVKCAATLDGWLATRTLDSKWVTGAAARAHVHQIRHEVDAIMVGIGTVRADNPSLTARLEEKQGKDPVRIVIDPSLTIAAKTRMLHVSSKAETILVAAEHVDPARIEHLQSRNVSVVTIKTKNGSIDFIALIDYLGERHITSLLIEGGGGVIGSALRANIVDKLLIFYAPKLLGGDDGVPMCRGSGPAAMNDCLTLRSIEIRRFGDDVLVEGYIDKHHSSS